MGKFLIIIGASGHGKVSADIAIKMNNWKTIMFLDDDEFVKTCMGLEVIGKISDAIKYKDKADFFVAIGNNEIRRLIQEKLIQNRFSLVTLVHPNAVVGTSVSIGIGTVVMAGAIINSDSTINNGCIINTGATIDHDNKIGDYVHISPGVNLAGNVRIGNGSWLGIGSVVINNISICSECKIGAGSVVVRDINEPGTYVGVPARRINI